MPTLRQIAIKTRFLLIFNDLNSAPFLNEEFGKQQSPKTKDTIHITASPYASNFQTLLHRDIVMLLCNLCAKLHNPHGVGFAHMITPQSKASISNYVQQCQSLLTAFRLQSCAHATYTRLALHRHQLFTQQARS